jgi:peptide deformylase
MALRQIREEQDPILRKISKEVKEVTPRMKQLIEDMKETMYHANGVGLAAPQVGILKRIILVDVDMEEEDLHVFINPVIVEEEGLCNGTEGCLSVPGEFGYVDRPEKIKLEYMDEDGKAQSLVAEDFFARAICHEVDHLNGILFIDKPEFQPAVMEDDEDVDE